MRHPSDQDYAVDRNRADDAMSGSSASAWNDLIINAISDIIFTVNLDGVLTFVSPQFTRLTGHQVTEVLGRHFADFLDEADRTTAGVAFQEIDGRTVGSSFVTLTLRFSSTEAYPVEVSVETLCGADGRALGTLGVARDIRGRLEADRALRDSEDRYRTILDTIEDGYYEVDLTGRYTKVNEALCRITAYPPAAIVGQSYKKIVDEASAATLLAVFNELYHSRGSGSIVIGTVLRADGELRHCEGSVSLLTDQDGAPAGFCGIIRDITERVKMAEALHQSEEKYRTIIENIEDAYYETDLSGHFLFFNEAFVRISLYQPEDLLGKSFRLIMDEGAIGRIWQAFSQVYETRRHLPRIDYEITRKDGSVRFAESSVSLIVDREGTVTGFRGVVRDVTDRRRMERALRVSERKWRQLYSSLPGGCIVVNEDHVIVDANRIAEELTGYLASELIGSHCGMICPYPAADCPVSRVDGVNIDNRETVIRTRIGGERPIIMSAERVETETGVLIIENFHDISRMKEIEAALRASEESLRRRTQAFEQDFAAARIINRSLLPSAPPTVKELQIGFRYVPLEAVGGDYFSFTPLAEGGLGVFLGDVSNHGISAALFLALVKATTDRICRQFAKQPREYITRLNQEMLGNMPQSFMTALYGLFHYDGDAVMFTFSSAGHPRPIHYRASTGGIALLPCRGTLIGMLEDLVYEERSMRLEKGDRLFLYTDGIPEAMNADGQIMGFDQMTELIAASHAPSLESTLDSIMNAVNAFRGETPLGDDIVIIGFEV